MKYGMLASNPHEREFCTWSWRSRMSWSTDDVKKARTILRAVPMTEAFVGSAGDSSSRLDTNIRLSRIGWVPATEDYQWVFSKMLEDAEYFNNRWYNFDLNGCQALQYTEYLEGGEYKGHMDLHLDTETPLERKLSLSLLLSSPNLVEGGSLQWFNGSDWITIPQQQGEIIAFPSFIIHRVSPITRGARRSLVAWIEGSRFR